MRAKSLIIIMESTEAGAEGEEEGLFGTWATELG